MYKFLNKLLFILGLRYPVCIDTEIYFQSKPVVPIALDQERGREIEIDISCFQMPKFCWRKILYWFYSTLIFGCIIIEPVFLIVASFKDRTLIYISNIAFLLIPPLLQLVIVRYFRSKSFDKIYYEVSLLKDTRHLIKNDTVLSFLILIPSVISIIVSSLFKFTTYNDNSLFQFYIANVGTASAVFLYIFQFVSWFYSRTITFLTLVIFFYVFFKHVNDMKTFIFVLNNHSVWSKDPTIISEFIHAIIKLRYELDNSIDKLSKVYVLATILGAIGLGNVISNKKLDSFTLISSIIFIICQLVFLLIIYLITVQQNKLSGIIMDPEFSIKYIYRKYRYMDYDITTKSPVLYKNIRQNSEVSDLSVTSIGRLLKNVYSPQYREESAQVIPLGNLQDMVRDDNLSVSVVGKRRKKHTTRHRDTVAVDVDAPDGMADGMADGMTDAADASPLTKDIIKTINNINNYNGSSIDYIILHLLISESWTSNFSLLGMQFNNTDSIQKALLITSVIITISGFISELQVYL